MGCLRARSSTSVQFSNLIHRGMDSRFRLTMDEMLIRLDAAKGLFLTQITDDVPSIRCYLSDRLAADCRFGHLLGNVIEYKLVHLLPQARRQRDTPCQDGARA